MTLDSVIARADQIGESKVFFTTQTQALRKNALTHGMSITTGDEVTDIEASEVHQGVMDYIFGKSEYNPLEQFTTRLEEKVNAYDAILEDTLSKYNEDSESDTLNQA